MKSAVAVTPDYLLELLVSPKSKIEIDETGKQIIDLFKQKITNANIAASYQEGKNNWQMANDKYKQLKKNAEEGNSSSAVQNFAVNANIYKSNIDQAMNDWITNGFKNEFESAAAQIDQTLKNE